MTNYGHCDWQKSKEAWSQAQQQQPMTEQQLPADDVNQRRDRPISPIEVSVSVLLQLYVSHF